MKTEVKSRNQHPTREIFSKAKFGNEAENSIEISVATRSKDRYSNSSGLSSSLPSLNFTS